MKKKFNILIRIIILLNFLSLSSVVFSKDNCSLFFDEMLNNYEKYEADLYPRFEYNDFGFELTKTWDNSAKEWNYYQNKDGFYTVGKIIDDNLVGKISIGDILVSANKKDLRKQNLDNYEKTINDIFSDKETIVFLFKNKKEYSLSLKKWIRDLVDPYADFYVRSLDIDEVSKKIEVRIQSSIAHSLNDEDTMYDLSKKYLWFDENDEVKNTKDCLFEVNDWEKAGFAQPASGLAFSNVHSIDYNSFESTILVKPYTHEVEWHKDNGWDNELYIEYSDDGIYNFNTNFNYKNFPFDKQIISLELINGFDLTDGVLTVSDFTKLYLFDFKNKNNIAGWNIVAERIKYGTYKDPIDLHSSSTVAIEIDIERKSGYYLYKVILPIIIILIVCWSSIYISPRELESKLTITIVCLLSLIAYNFIIDGEIPKLEYLTIMDWIILASYVYAALPNVVAIHSFNLYKSKKNRELNRLNNLTKRYGLLSYLIVIFSIIIFNINTNYENASSVFSWLVGK